MTAEKMQKAGNSSFHAVIDTLGSFNVSTT